MSGKVYYYVRVSSMEQNTDRQLTAFKGADRVFIDKLSGKDRNRPELKAVLPLLEEEDTLVVKSLDRLSRSTIDLLEIVRELENKKAHLEILDLKIDTKTATGKMFITMLGAIAEFERATIKQRTAEGIEIAKQKGDVFRGRKEGSITIKGEALERFKKFYKLGMNKSDLSREFNVPRATIYRWEKVLKERGELI